MRGLRIASAVVVGAAALAGAWIVGGNALASRHERAAEQAFEGTFGPRSALEAKGATAETTPEARRAEELAKAIGYDLTPKRRSARLADEGGGFSEKERAAIGDYLTAQLVRPEDAVSAPSPEVATLLERRRAALTTFEEFLASVPPPRWAFDPRVDLEERRVPNAFGHIRLQRLMIADALATASRGDGAASARALESSWRLNDGLASRPETVLQLIAMAVARLEVGAVRRIRVSEEAWTRRLAAMGGRARLVDAIILDRSRLTDSVARYKNMRPAGVGWWAHNLVSLLEEPRDRLADADDDEAFRRALAGLRDEPAFREEEPERFTGKSATGVTISIVIPNLRNAFQRADRLALEAELTGKILRLKEVRRARGAWPRPSAEISSSRFPGLSWNYSVDGGAMTIALVGRLPKPPSPFVLPTSFSSRAPSP